MNEYEILTQSMNRIERKIDNLDAKLDDKISSVYKKMNDDYVTCKEFEPVKHIAFGLIAIIVVTVLGAILYLVVGM